MDAVDFPSGPESEDEEEGDEEGASERVGNFTVDEVVSFYQISITWTLPKKLIL